MGRMTAASIFLSATENVLVCCHSAGTVLWSDEFNGSSVDSNVWTHQLGSVGPGIQKYTNDSQNAYIENGQLVIQAVKNGNQYTSARFTSNGKVHMKQGRAEARMQMPSKGRGSLPAFWMMGADFPDVGWPTNGEIDIMEWPGCEVTNVHATVHSKYKTHGQGTTVPTVSSEFHVYGFEWTETSLTFDVDGRVYHTFSRDSVEKSCASGASEVSCWPFSEQFYFLLTMQIGSPWCQDQGIDTSAFPMQMRVDWIRVYALSSSEDWVLRADGNAGENGCGDTPTWHGPWSGEASCRDHCRSAYSSTFVETHGSANYCGCFSSCDFKRPVSEYGAPAKVYEFVSSGGSGNYLWVRRASGDERQSGCSDTSLWAGDGYDSVQKCTDHCEATYESIFVEFHPRTKWCGCFHTCDFRRPVQEYGSPADVYEKLAQTSYVLARPQQDAVV